MSASQSTATVSATSTPIPHNSIKVVQKTTSVSPGAQQAASVLCGSSQQMVGGGYVLAPDAVALTADDSYPSSQNEWTASVTNNVSQTVQLTVFAACLISTTSLNITIIRSDPATVAAGIREGVAANCPSGIITGGGFATNPGFNGIVLGSTPDPLFLTGWGVRRPIQPRHFNRNRLRALRCRAFHHAHRHATERRDCAGRSQAARGKLR